MVAHSVRRFDWLLPPLQGAARPSTRLSLLALQGIGGLGGGIGLVIAPDGALLRMPVSFLEGSPFSDYLIPGLVLASLLGVFPLLVLAGLWRRRSWSWYGAFLVGSGLIIFEIVELMIVPFSVLQPIFSTVGALIATLCLVRPVMRYAGVTPPWADKAET